MIFTFPSSQRRGGCAERSEGADGVVGPAKSWGAGLTTIEASPYRARASRRARSASPIGRSLNCGQTGAPRFRRTDHPVCAFASLGASTPPLRGGECKDHGLFLFSKHDI